MPIESVRKELLSHFENKTKEILHSTYYLGDITQNPRAYPVMISKTIPTPKCTNVPQKSKRKRTWYIFQVCHIHCLNSAMYFASLNFRYCIFI